MANPDDVGVDSYDPALIAATGTPDSVALDPNKVYQLFHNGVDTSGSGATGIIMCCTLSGATAALTSGPDKFLLLSGRDPLFLGPGVNYLKFDANSGSPTFSIIPLGTDFGAH